MNKKKTNTTSNQQYTTNYGWQQSPITSEMQAVIDASKQPAQADPSIMHRYAALGEDLERSYMDPFGAATSPDVREKAQRSQMLKLGTERDKAMRESYQDSQGQQFGKQLAAAGLTAPQLVSTGGTSSGTSNTVQSGGFWASVIPGLAMGAGSAAA